MYNTFKRLYLVKLVDKNKMKEAVKLHMLTEEQYEDIAGEKYEPLEPKE